MGQAGKRKVWSGRVTTEAAADFFGPPPLIQGENRPAYEALLAKISALVKPQDLIEEIYVRDVVDLSWEIWRLRRQKAGLVSASMGEGIKAVLSATTSVLSGDVLEHETLPGDWMRGEPHAQKRVNDLLQSAELDLDSVRAQALAVKIDVVERIDRMSMGVEVRRTAAFREIERHRSQLGRRLRDATKQIEDAEYEELTHGEAAE